MEHSVVFSNTISQLVAKLVSSFTSFVIALMVASFFGPKGFGEFTLVITYVSLFYLISDFGLNAVFLHQKNHEKHAQDLFILRIVISSVLFLISIFISLFFTSNKDYWNFQMGVFIFSLTIYTQTMITTASAIFQRKLRYDLLAKATILGSLITVISAIFLIRYNSLSYLFFSFVLGGIASSFLSLLFLNSQFSFRKISFPFMKKLFVESFPLALMLFFNMIYFRADIFILSFLRPQEDVGVYAYAYKFFDFFLTLPLFLSNSLYPFLLEDYKKNKKISLGTKKYFIIGFFLSLFITIIGWFIAPFISFIRPDFKDSIWVFRILMLSFPIFSLTSFVQWNLIAKKEQKYLLVVYVISAAFNILFNFLLIPIFGLIAAAVATGVSELIVLIALFGKISKKAV